MNTVRRFHSIALFTCALVVLSGERVRAQELPRLEFDEQQQVFVLSYRDDEGIQRTVEIVGPNRIRPSTETSIDGRDAEFVYRYTIANRDDPASRQPIGVWEMPCPEVFSVAAPDGWSASVRESTVLGGGACDFGSQREATAIAPGRELSGFKLTTNHLPSVDTARFEGVIQELPSLPGIDGETPRAIAELYSRAIGAASEPGVLAGWRTLPMIVPGRSPEQVDSPPALLSAIASELDRVCDLGWISNRGICNSLRKKLRNADRSLDRGKTKAARDQLRAFLRELEAQHGDQPGKRVNDNAFALLTTNAEFLLEQIG